MRIKSGKKVKPEKLKKEGWRESGQHLSFQIWVKEKQGLYYNPGRERISSVYDLVTPEDLERAGWKLSGRYNGFQSWNRKGKKGRKDALLYDNIENRIELRYRK